MTASRHAPRHRFACLILLTAALCANGAFDTPAHADMAAAQAAIAAGNFPAAGAALAPLASAGDAQAQFQWASLALDGRAVGLAPERAISLLVQAAAQGNGHAQARLGMAYAQGDHVAIDKLAAYHWLSRASTAPELSSSEREQVASLRQDLLEEIAPTRKYTPPAPGDSAPGVSTAGDNQAIPAAEKAAAAPATSVASVPLFSSKPLPNPSDDADISAPAADAEAGGKAAGEDQAHKSAKRADAKKATAPLPLVTPAATKAATPPAAVALASAPQTALSTAAGGKAYFVQLASLPTESAATAEANRLARKYADILKGIDVGVHQADLGAKGLMQRVLAGPFDNLPAAKDHCARLTARKQDCRVIAASN